MSDDKPMSGDAEPNEGDPIKPEVVRRSAASRKRRAAEGEGTEAGQPSDAPPVPPDQPPARRATGTIFRMGCLLLVGLGAIELFLASQLVFDPEGARCRAARFQIEDANDDDEDFNDVDLPEGIEDPGDIECEEAIALAGDIPEDEDEPADGSFTNASAFRTQGIIVTVLGLGHGLSGFFTLRTRKRIARTIALVFIGVGLLFPVLGIISMLALAFVVFALVFSADAREIFGDRGRGGLLRPRVPPAP